MPLYMPRIKDMADTIMNDTINLKTLFRESVIVLGLICLCSAVAYVWFYYEAEKQARRDLSLNFELKKTTLEDEITSSLSDLEALVDMATMRTAASNLDAAWQALGNTPDAVIQQWYGNGDVPGTRALSIRPPADYFQLVDEQESWVVEFMRLFDLHDILLINNEGDVIYSYLRGPDYTTNLRSGPYSETNLSNIFLRALRNRGRAVLSEMEFYGRDGTMPTFFSAASLTDAVGHPFAVLALQYKPTLLNNIMQRTESMGYTGDIFVIDITQKMLSQSRLISELTALRVLVDSTAAEQASYGFSGMQRSIDHRGVRTLSAYAPVNISGPAWGLVGQMDLWEIAANAVQPTVLLNGITGGMSSWLFLLFARFILTSRRQSSDVSSS